MDIVYLVEHSYEIGEFDEIKHIGIYSTKEKAEEVVEKYKLLPGFKNYTDGFYISECELDKNHWEEGFIKWTEADDTDEPKETAIKSYLKECMEDNKIVSVFSDINEPSKCSAGFICAISTEQVLIKHVTCDGLYDGYRVRKLENIYRVDKDSQYERKLESLYFIKNQSHKDILFKGLTGDFNIFQEMLIKSNDIGFPVSIDIDETGSQALIIGLIEEIRGTKVVIKKITEYGEEDGESIILLDDIISLNCDSFDEHTMLLLYKNNLKNKEK